VVIGGTFTDRISRVITVDPNGTGGAGHGDRYTESPTVALDCNEKLKGSNDQPNRGHIVVTNASEGVHRLDAFEAQGHLGARLQEKAKGATNEMEILGSTEGC